MPAAPLLALPSLQPGIPSAVASTSQASANAALCRFLIDAGAVREDDLPDGEADPLKACQHAIDAWIYKRKFYQTLREADRIIAISERTRQDIIELGGFPRDRIDLVYQSCDTRYRLLRSEDELQKIHAEYDLPPRYILNVGTVEERKNVLLAVKALEKLPADLSLIIVGRQTKYAEKVKRYSRRHQLVLLHQVGHGRVFQGVRFAHRRSAQSSGKYAKIMAEILAFSPSRSQQGLETSASALYSPAQLSTWIKAEISPAVLRKA